MPWRRAGLQSLTAPSVGNPRHAGGWLVRHDLVPLGQFGWSGMGRVDNLAGQEWVGRSALVRHQKHSPKEFRCRDPMQSRFYYQPLLQRDALMVSGARPIQSGRMQAFYRLLLMARNVADETSSEQCNRLRQKEGDATSLAFLETAPPRVERLRKDVQFLGDDDGACAVAVNEAKGCGALPPVGHLPCASMSLRAKDRAAVAFEANLMLRMEPRLHALRRMSVG